MIDNRTTELLPCPFCGGEAEIERYTIKPYVACTKCGCSMPDRHQSESEAIAAWNTRAELVSGTCRITASATDGLCSDNPRKWFELSCGHSFTLDGLGAPVACAVCGKAVKR